MCANLGHMYASLGHFVCHTARMYVTFSEMHATGVCRQAAQKGNV
jgi:hypothetical protein